MIRALYEQYLLRQINRKQGQIPEHITMILSESDLLDDSGKEKLGAFMKWCFDLDIKIISIYVDVLDVKEEAKTKIVSLLLDELKEIIAPLPDNVGFDIYNEKGELIENKVGDTYRAHFSVGFGGKNEITKAITSILHDVKDEKLSPSDIDENTIESYLTVREEPDIIIRAGGKHLSNFLLWQSAYSELYFTDVNWHGLRRMDILRIIRDYQKRQRRFGK
jgi:undecaprenyl diphosphate synthase